MEIVTFSEARNNLKAVLDSVVNNHMPTVIFRQRGESVVVIPKDAYDRMNDSLYLSASPANAARLRESMAEMDAGGGVSIDREALRKL